MIGKDKAYKKEASCTLFLGISSYGKYKLLVKFQESYKDINTFKQCFNSRDYLRNNIKYYLMLGCDNIYFSKILVVSVHIEDEDINISPVCSLSMDRFNRNIMIQQTNEEEKIFANSIDYSSMI